VRKIIFVNAQDQQSRRLHSRRLAGRQETYILRSKLDGMKLRMVQNRVITVHCSLLIRKQITSRQTLHKVVAVLSRILHGPATTTADVCSYNNAFEASHKIANTNIAGRSQLQLRVIIDASCEPHSRVKTQPTLLTKLVYAECRMVWKAITSMKPTTFRMTAYLS
jgi:hypothetical protein